MTTKQKSESRINWIESPLGRMAVRVEMGAITALNWSRSARGDSGDLAQTALEQLRQYFDGTRQVFDLPLKLGNTAFQERFLQSLLDIPFGETRTYGELAKTLGVSAQAIGQACGANPIPVIIPCHRVLAADGLGGFSGSGGIEAKVALLKHEGSASLLI